MTEPEHTQEHGQHLPRNSDGNQKQGREARERIEDKQLANGTTSGKSEHVLQRFGMPRQKRDGGRQFRLCGWRNGEGENSMKDAAGRQVRHNTQIESGQGSGQDILRHHHLRPSKTRVDLRGGKDVVLRGVREAIQK